MSENNFVYEAVEETAVAPVSKSSKVMGIIGMICGILGLCCSMSGIIGIIYAIAGLVLSNIAKKGNEAKFSKIGKVLSVIALILSIIGIIVSVAFVVIATLWEEIF